MDRLNYPHLNPHVFSRENKDDLKCTYCGPNHHTEDTCFSKHGVPDWFPELTKLRAKVHGNNEGECASVAAANTSSTKGAEATPTDYSQPLLTRANQAQLLLGVHS
ncbi:hypothetical protein DVH24_007998 [Malus domestica]|uniref:Uncharacterized protein n=1 Tax=Malus domestica TaxID=3750 RepID=A0A498JIE0_MALDO|nr:hypothetical protein DVH24_007998 [Malus domestica]